MQRKEHWRPVPIKEFKSKYEVSTYGRVRSCRNRILKQNLVGNGYCTVYLSNRQFNSRFYVHRLVAKAFISNPKKYPEVNHIDEDPSNNRMENLEWCSHQYNSTYGTIREKIWWRKHIGQFDADGNMIAYYDSLSAVCKVNGYNRSNISSCCQGRKKLVHGYNWKFIDCPYPTPQLKIGKQVKFHTYRIVYAGGLKC